MLRINLRFKGWEGWDLNQMSFDNFHYMPHVGRDFGYPKLYMYLKQLNTQYQLVFETAPLKWMSFEFLNKMAANIVWKRPFLSYGDSSVMKYALTQEIWDSGPASKSISVSHDLYL